MNNIVTDIELYVDQFLPWLEENASPGEMKKIIKLAISLIGIQPNEWRDNPDHFSRLLALEILRGLVKQFEDEWNEAYPQPDPGGDFEVDGDLKPGLAGFGED